MKKIIGFLNSIQAKIEAISKDKIIHFAAGLLLAQTVYFSMWFVFIPILAGLIKEAYDCLFRKTGFNPGDILATWLGVLPAVAVKVVLIAVYS